MTKEWKPLSIGSPEVEAQALNETEDAMRELIKTGRLIGISKASLAFMLNRLSNELMPSAGDVHPEAPTVQ